MGLVNNEYMLILQLYGYLYANCQNEPYYLVPPVQTFTSGTRCVTFTESSQTYFFSILNMMRKLQSENFFPGTTTFWNTECYSEHYNVNRFKTGGQSLSILLILIILTSYDPLLHSYYKHSL